MATEQKRIRVQLDFDQQGFDELETLKSDLRAGSRADTVRLGLGLLRWAVNQLRGGGRILVEKDGHLSGVVFPFLPEPQVRTAAAPLTLKAKEIPVAEFVDAEDLLKEERQGVREAMHRAREAGRAYFKGKTISPGQASAHYKEEEQG